jgi:hypothetical protein
MSGLAVSKVSPLCAGQSDGMKEQKTAKLLVAPLGLPCLLATVLLGSLAGAGHAPPRALLLTAHRDGAA